MTYQHKDWKDVADSYRDKAMSLAVLLFLFAFMVSPSLEVKPFEKKAENLVVLEAAPIEEQEQIKPPEEQTIQEVTINLEEIEAESDEEDIPILDTAFKNTIASQVNADVKPVSHIPDKNEFVMYENAPVLIKSVTPKKSDFAKKIGLKGTVILDAFVNDKGKVEVVEINKGIEGLNESAMEAMKQWVFQPAKVDNKPIGIWIIQPIIFE